MTDEPSSDPSSEADRPIILGGPSASGTEAAAASPPPGPELEREAPEIGPAAPGLKPSQAPVPQRRSLAMPLLGVLGFVVLAAAIGYLWVRPAPLPAMPAMPPDESGAVTALQSDLATLKTRLAALDTRETSDVAALHAAIAALPAATTATATPSPATPAAQTSSTAQKSTAAETSSSTGGSTAAESPTPSQTASSSPTSSPTPASTPASSSATAQNSAPPAPSAAVVAQASADAALIQSVASLSNRIDQLQSAEAAQAQQAQSLPSAADVSKIASRVDDVGQRESKDENAIRQDLSLVQQQLATLSGQAQTLTKTSAAVPKLTAQADRLGQIVRAQEALRAGLPLGTIANAPPALARYADTAPPTQAALQLSFTNAAQAADKAGEPVPDQGHFWHRVWLRAQNLVMVRQGDHVVLGDPTSAILAHAQTVLDAGDLSGALAVLGTLTGPAAQAMAPWEAQARALLEAREALTHMAAG